MAALKISKIKVSSVLNDDTKNYGKQFLLDDSDETCWNSAAGNEQYVMVQLEGPSKLSAVKLMFQGGFVAKHCDLCLKEDGKWTPVHSFYPIDNNAFQSFQVPDSLRESTEWAIYFRSPTDFFGRITLYRLVLEGILS